MSFAKKIEEWLKEVISPSRVNAGDPYSADMKKFVTDVVVHDSKQAFYYALYQDYPTIANILKTVRDDNSGEFLRFELEEDKIDEFEEEIERLDIHSTVC